MANSIVRDFIGSVLLERASGAQYPGVRRPQVRTPSPYDTDGMDISDRFRPVPQYGFPASASVSQSIREDDPSGPEPYTGPLDVTAMTQSVADQFVGAPRGLSAAMAPVGFSTLMGFGSAISLKNLQRIEAKIAEGEAGYGLAMLNGRIVGVSPGIFGDDSYVFSGVLPENLTHNQRVQLRDAIMAAGKPVQYRQTPDYSPGAVDQQVGVAPPPEPTDEELAASGRANIVYEERTGLPVTVGSGRDFGNIVTTGAGRYESQADLQKQLAAKQAADRAADIATDKARRDEALTRAVSEAERDDSDKGQPRNEYSFSDTGGFGPAGFRAKGGTVQRTGFVSGSPDNYTKSETVADTVNTQVRENSFVLNAPTVETLQRAGMLPTGVDKSNKNTTIKANKGGLMPVALSKGEYVIEPEEAQRIGYSFLEKINDQGKAEVDRRQAAADGGFINGYAAGDMVLPVSSPVRQAIAEDEEVVEKQLDLDGAYQRIKNKFSSIKKANEEIDRTIDELPAPDILAFMMIQEASVLGREGMRASGHVAMNRVHSDYKDFAKITDLKSMAKAKTKQGGYQFNVFNISDYRKGLKALTQTEYGRKAYQEARDLAEDIFHGLDEDNTRGALFFRNPATSTDKDFQSKVENAKYVPTLTVRGQKSTQEYYRPIELMDAEDTRYIY